MGLAFSNEMHDEFGAWPVAYIPYGGANLGEILAVGRTVGDGDDTAYYDAWVAAGDSIAAEGAEAERRGLRGRASELFLRASAFYAAAYHPLYRMPVDPRLLAAFRKQMAVFDKGLVLSASPATPMRIPFEGASMPAYFIPAAGYAQEVRPLVILNNGYTAFSGTVFRRPRPAAGKWAAGSPVSWPRAGDFRRGGSCRKHSG